MQTQLSLNFDDLAGSHDVRLSAWGPYSKRYIGISHIPKGVVLSNRRVFIDRVRSRGKADFYACNWRD